MRKVLAGTALAVLAALGAAKAARTQPPPAPPAPQAWLTDADHRRVLAPVPLAPATGTESSWLRIDPTARRQPIDGFGFALTGGSAGLLQRMSPVARHRLLVELFGRGDGELGVSWLRVSIGSSDLDDRVFTYDDLPPGARDPALAGFSLAPDERALIPTLREILAIAPGLPILASPWSMPGWMKTRAQPKGGALRPEMSEVFARYLVAYVQGMAARGVPIAAVTLQNEPENANNTPSMLMPASQQAALIAEYVGPAFHAAGLATRIVGYDHNCDHPAYPLAVLGDMRAAAFVAGTGFHLYAGEATTLAQVQAAYPDKPVWLTEQMVIDAPGVSTARPVARVLIGALANGAQGVLLWNLAADPRFGPHAGDGGCAVCEGALTLDGDRVTRNMAYAALAPFSRLVPPGSVRLGLSGDDDALPAVAFQTPTNERVLVLANPGPAARTVRLHNDDTPVAAVVPAGAVLAVRWPRGLEPGRPEPGGAPAATP